MLSRDNSGALRPSPHPRRHTALLALAVVFEIGAVALTPTPMQRWMSRSYFGKDPSWFDWDGKRDDMFKKGDWKAEADALRAALREAAGDPANNGALTHSTQTVAAQ